MKCPPPENDGQGELGRPGCGKYMNMTSNHVLERYEPECSSKPPQPPGLCPPASDRTIKDLGVPTLEISPQALASQSDEYEAGKIQWEPYPSALVRKQRSDIAGGGGRQVAPRGHSVGEVRSQCGRYKEEER